MKVDTFGDGDDLLWVMGFGNEVESRHERWFVDYLVESGYRVHAIELPTNDPDFEGSYVRPVGSYLGDLEDPVVAAHSMGGLVTAYLRPEARVAYLSPWWGTDLPTSLRLLLGLPTTLRVLPSGVSADGLGDLATEADATAPGRVSPAWLRAMVRAQSALPAIDPDDTVFYSPDDEVVSVEAIRDHADPDRLETYEGGHELFASEGREAHAERVVEAVAD